MTNVLRRFNSIPILEIAYYNKYEKETEPEQINALKSTTIVFDRTTYILATFSMAGWLNYLGYKFEIKNRLLYSGITYAVTAGLFFYLGQKSYNDYKDSAVPEDVENTYTEFMRRCTEPGLSQDGLRIVRPDGELTLFAQFYIYLAWC